MTRTHHRICLSTGVCLDHAVQGPLHGIPVLLLPGITGSWRSFEPVMDMLPPDIRAYALSQRGHGDSDRPARGYALRTWAHDAAAFIRAVGAGPMLVVGHSMGSAVALRLAIDHPRLLSGLVLVGAFAGVRHRADLAAYVRGTIEPLRDPIAPPFVRQFQLGSLARAVPGTFLDRVVAESLKVPAAVWRAGFAALFHDDYAAELHRVAAPVQIHWGDRDTHCPRDDQDRLLRGIASARLVEHAGAGHALHWERPTRFASELASFARELRAERVLQAA